MILGKNRTSDPDRSVVKGFEGAIDLLVIVSEKVVTVSTCSDMFMGLGQ